MANMAVWKVDCIVGARPNFVKIAPVIRSLNNHGSFAARLIHTGQHYDVAMNAVFFDELGIPEPDVNLEVGSDTQTGQTARIMLGLEKIFSEGRPDMLVVVGDVNSTLAAALVASKLQIRLAHVEAGLRSSDRTMPEEINRLVTDRLADLLLTTEREAESNLLREGALPEQIYFAGNVMIDTLRACLGRAQPALTTMQEYGAEEEFLAAVKFSGFGFVTLHRPSNVDDPVTLRELLQALSEMSRDLPLLFAMHPRTKTIVAANGLEEVLGAGRILVTPPLSYLRALGMLREARVAITDSGGIQEETTALGVPCLTVRSNTERPVTVAEGTNILVGTSPTALRGAFWEVLASGGKRGRIPEYWDGKAADRIVGRIEAFLQS